MKKIDYLQKIFEKAQVGNLTIYLPENKSLVFKGDKDGPSCDININDLQVINMVAKRGDIGLGEAYHKGLFTSSDLMSFLTYCSLNIDFITNNGNGSIINKLLFYFYNKLIRINTKYGSKKNILAHYDIGNDFYKLWLDPTMTYSSGIRVSNDDSLEQAQINKYDRIIQRLDIKNKSLLEIGCGWGGFANRAKDFGANITGITISDNQYNFAKERLDGKAKILMQDYRDVESKFDRIVSIEMFEAVGEKYWSTYFNQIKRSLVQNGRAIIQTITIDDSAFEQYRKNSDYIRHHVFPGGMLPSKKRFCEDAKKAGLSVVDIFEFGYDYAWTLREWYKNFKNKMEELSKIYPIDFLRAWEFYLSISVAGFESGRTNVMQVEIVN
jgi:cyclopropane-fatty-acyl-phospholipid synthase